MRPAYADPTDDARPVIIRRAAAAVIAIVITAAAIGTFAPPERTQPARTVTASSPRHEGTIGAQEIEWP
ncbi:hypothetical protein [Winogradskya humida]|uniref:Uncharacterized protein n=1 Tax=Winogradskya humida TaxID=113566 RepID=A0ABQ4A142_9ACTN|nr:hypothetical protein [Actinoplanes humidus]GIE24552.1 hypothetical protein Ahu01nite_076540 [Actinoplanes humidus]